MAALRRSAAALAVVALVGRTEAFGAGPGRLGRRFSMVAQADSLAAAELIPDQRRISLSIPERARTVTHAAKSGTLCTVSIEGGELAGMPFGSYVDYVLDEQGWPVLLLSEQSMHTRNMMADGRVSMLVQMRSMKKNVPSAAQPRCTVAGRITKVEDNEEILRARVSYPLEHAYAEQIVESPTFSFYKIVPERVYYVGGFGVLSEWVNVADYEASQPDVLAAISADLVDRINDMNDDELPNLWRQFFAEDSATAEEPETIRVTTIDRLGMDIRVRHGAKTDEFRLGFRMPASTLEDAQSEITKLFQEAWEMENGYYEGDSKPPVQLVAKDSLRRS